MIMANFLAMQAEICHYHGMKCDIEIFQRGIWAKAASFELNDPGAVDKGVLGSGFFEYDLDYALDHLNAGGIDAVSCRFPVDFEYRRLSGWPAFLLDILPAGANRRFFLNELGIENRPSADWPLLLKGGGNPPGNIRIAQAAPPSQKAFSHEGFRYEEVLDRGEDFIEYARENNAPVAGSSGAQGEAPKFLLTQDRGGRWHSDGALPDDLAHRHWLVKFPRGKQQSDRDILRNEGAYHRVARKAGLRVGAPVRHDVDVLFVPRFDRETVEAGVHRLGLESLASLSDVASFGAPVSMETLCGAISRFSSDPAADIQEFVFRDVLNVAMGNTDNHGRNSAVLKTLDGAVRLAPFFDFAPMFLDDQGIPRICRWTGAESGGMPDWGDAVEGLKAFGMDAKALRAKLAGFSGTVERLPDIMAGCGVDGWLIERLFRRIGAVRASLQNADPAVYS